MSVNIKRFHTRGRGRKRIDGWRISHVLLRNNLLLEISNILTEEFHIRALIYSTWQLLKYTGKDQKLMNHKGSFKYLCTGHKELCVSVTVEKGQRSKDTSVDVVF